jgi:hypothetical protein
MVAFYQVSVHLVKWFQRRRFLEIDQSETRIDYGSHVCNESGQNEQSSSGFISKHGRHRQFLFLIGRFLKIFFPETS